VTNHDNIPPETEMYFVHFSTEGSRTVREPAVYVYEIEEVTVALQAHKREDGAIVIKIEKSVILKDEPRYLEITDSVGKWGMNFVNLAGADVFAAWCKEQQFDV